MAEPTSTPTPTAGPMAEPMADPEAQQTKPPKPIHSLVVDTGPLIKNDPPVDVLRSRAEQIYLLPTVIPEIRDAATRTRVQTALLPFATVRGPRPDSVRTVAAFARRTGDLEVLSRPDLEVLALTYELECERNGGDWRLRSTPGQKTLNGKPPAKEGQQGEDGQDGQDGQVAEETDGQDKIQDGQGAEASAESADAAALDNGIQKLHIDAAGPDSHASTDPETAEMEAHNVAHEGADACDLADTRLVDGEKADEVVDDEDESDDDDGWITPSNIKKHKARDGTQSSQPDARPVTMQAAVLTSDFAMQNVALRMNLNLVSPSLSRISRLRTWLLRCHGCFQTTRDMDRRFCPTCGQPTLMRAACTVDDRTGAVTVHLKKNFQWNNRGNVYSVPKPVSGTASGRPPKGSKKGRQQGGRNGWGQDLILAEDQKEHVRATDEQRRARTRDLMDADYLPGILGGDRSGGAGKIRVGAGRNVNSRRRA